MRKPLALLAVCGALLACDTRISGIAAPFSAELGTYVLASYNGKAVPAPLPDTVPNTLLVLVADTVQLTSGGNVREARYITATPTGSGTAVTTSSSNIGRYTITRDSLGFSGILLRSARIGSGTLTAVDAQGFEYVFDRR
jgi:hypothetical protein